MIRLIEENGLDQWVRGHAEEAQGVIVELIWRLVAACCPLPRERRFPLGDSVGQHGPDGVLVHDLGFQPFVPEGRSVWQIGAGINAGKKATKDYDDLTAAVPQQTRLESTFVFVTPLSGRRDWEYTWKEDAQADWLQSRIVRTEWKDLRIIDGTKLIDWLHHFPTVELWLARRTLGLHVDGVETLEERWAVVKCFGEPPPLIPTLFLANRQEATEKVKEVFKGTTIQVRLTTHYADQAVSFMAALLASMPDEDRIDAAGRCLIVSNGNTWSTICNQRGNLILIGDPALDLLGEGGARLIQKGRSAGHAVILTGPPGGLPDPASIALPMPREHEVRQALEEAGYAPERARTLAARTRGNLTSLLRMVQNLSLLPEWADRSGAYELAIAAALGAWTDSSESDKTVVEGVAGKAYRSE